jgi:hypothetical protein
MTQKHDEFLKMAAECFNNGIQHGEAVLAAKNVRQLRLAAGGLQSISESLANVIRQIKETPTSEWTKECDLAHEACRTAQ